MNRLFLAHDCGRLNGMKRTTLILTALFLAALYRVQAEENPHDLPDGLYTEITTERGVVVCELFYQKTPMTVASYAGLAEGTLGPKPRKPFYEGVKWHRVVPGFVVQGGDPTGTGDGGPGYEFPDEFVPGLRHDSMGVLQMANDGPDSNGSQYCLMLSPQQRLNYLHTVFGHVARGMEVLPKIQQGDTMHVKILRLGLAAKGFAADEAALAGLVAKAKRYAGPRESGPDAPFDDPDKILPTEWNRAKTFNFKLANFERFTGTKLVARVFAKPPISAEGGKLDEWLESEASRLGVAKRGALAVYFADQDKWYLKIGIESVAQFISTTPIGEKSLSKKSLGEAEQEFLDACRARGAEFIATAVANATPDKPLANGQKIKLKVDAVLDGLIFKLEPR
jgi:cyclophilin family peptidyl-prolyl cis-trans isomerase